jgi:hypothetical protein
MTRYAYLGCSRKRNCLNGHRLAFSAAATLLKQQERLRQRIHQARLIARDLTSASLEQPSEISAPPKLRACHSCSEKLSSLWVAIGYANVNIPNEYLATKIKLNAQALGWTPRLPQSSGMSTSITTTDCAGLGTMEVLQNEPNCCGAVSGPLFGGVPHLLPCLRGRAPFSRSPKKIIRHVDSGRRHST